MSVKKPVVLLIMDGFGIREDAPGNAVSAASTPNINALFDKYPLTYLSASGEDVGLPAGQIGNSEVGHANIGAGRIVYQDLSMINRAISGGEFFNNPVLLKACDRAVQGGKAVHIMGLLSDGGVHSHQNHIEAAVKLAKSRGVKKLYLHMFTDGRDVLPTSGAGFVEKLDGFLRSEGVGEIATIAGRYYAMDRDNRWQRVAEAYSVITKKPLSVMAPLDIMKASYAENVTDEFVKPTACIDGGRVEDGDSIIMINFRPDRMRELTKAFTQPDFAGFEREAKESLYVATMTEYEAGMPGVEVAFAPKDLKNTLGDILESNGLKQLRVAETEKYAHVTFFFDGGNEITRPNEKRVLIPSPKVATYDLEPRMRAAEITGEVLSGIRDYDFILLNYANCDMVGHTGVFDAAVKAVEEVDKQVGRLTEAVLSAGGTLLITADHGNAEEMIAPEGGPMTAHTTNKVPLCMVGSDYKLTGDGILADIAPTLLELLGLKQPAEMTGQSLILKA